MAIIKIEKKDKKLDISNVVGEEAYITIKYINRDVWRYANRLTLKTVDTLVYQEIINNKDYKQIQKKLEMATGAEKIKLLNDLNQLTGELTAKAYNNISIEKLEETKKIEDEKNKILIENGLDQDEHNLYDEKGQKIKLKYELLKELHFFDYVLNEIVKHNGEYDLGK